MTEDSGNWFKRRQALKVASKAAYSGLMRAALAPRYFVAGDVADTFEGRSQIVTLHAGLVMRRLRGADGDRGRKLAEAVNTLVLDGFDAAFRENGVGDSSIARKMRKLAETHYGLGKVFTAALGLPDRREQVEAIDDVLRRNGVIQHDRPSEFPGYLAAQDERFRGHADEDVLAGNFHWVLFD